MFISRRKYELEKQWFETRIDQLEWIICKGNHEYEKVKSEIIADGNGYGDLYHDVYICKKCERREYIDRKKLMDDLSPIVYKNGAIVNKLASDVVYQIQDRNTADVVECVEYEKLYKEYKHYRRLVEQDDDLRSKIDKAIEDTYEIRREVLYNDNGCYEPNDVLDIIDQITKLFEEL